MKVSSVKLLIILFSFLIISSCKDDDSDELINDPKAENLKALGDSAEDLLSDDIYKSLTVEFLITNGYRPMQASLDNFKDFLNTRLNKSGGITYVETNIPNPSGSPFSLSEIRDIETEERTQYSTGDDIAVYVFFSNGNFAGDTNSSVTLGTAYRNTSIVIYEKTLQDVSASQGSDLFILEATTLRHEFGHILGLVNIKDDDIHQNHEDTVHTKHCIVEECLMYFAINESRSFMNRRSIPELDPLCIEDLQAKGGK